MTEKVFYSRYYIFVLFKGKCMLETMISQQNLDAVRLQVDKGKRFVVLAHKNPDGDALGSSLALYHYLRSLGKEVLVVLPNAFPVLGAPGR